MIYRPSKLPSVNTPDGQAIAQYFENELKTIAVSLSTGKVIQINPSFTPPDRPRTGMVVYADGVKWNPGNGEGLYVYSSGGNWIWLETQPAVVQKPAAFSVSMTVDQTGIANSTFTKVLWNTVDFDSDSWWDATNRRYTPQRAGHYLFAAEANNQASTGTITSYVISLYKNGTEHTRLMQNGAGAVGGGGGAMVVHMNGTSDFVEIFVFITATTARAINGTPPNSPRFSGAMVRAD